MVGNGWFLVASLVFGLLLLLIKIDFSFVLQYLLFHC